MLEIHNLVEAKSTAVEASHRLYIGDTNPASQSNLIVIEASERRGLGLNHGPRVSSCIPAWKGS